jgi:hypothetical protein
VGGHLERVGQTGDTAPENDEVERMSLGRGHQA